MRSGIEQFLLQHAEVFYGTVLDYGCGAQPYRAIVEKSGSNYYGWDRPWLPDSKVTDPIGDDNPLEAHWQTILCTEVISLLDEPLQTLLEMHDALLPGGFLVMTYPHGYRQFHSRDRWRFTLVGMNEMLRSARFRVD